MSDIPDGQPQPLEAKGRGALLIFDGRTVTITRKGVLGRMVVGKGTKTIPRDAISAVQLKPAGWAINGFISFTLAGAIEDRRGFGAQTWDAAKDENSVVFTKQQQPAFEAIREAIETAKTAPTTSGQPVSVADELAKLARLRDAGALSDAEFEAQKARLLS
jgi:hypothetical protein